MAVPWTSPVPAAVKGIIHVPAHNTPIKASRREALLIAIAKARRWIDDLAHGRAASFAVIARREGKAERHIRLLAPLAFVSPRIVAALLDGTAPADLTLTKLARALPYCWAEQERRVGTSAQFHCFSGASPAMSAAPALPPKAGSPPILLCQVPGVDIKGCANSTSDSSSATTLQGSPLPSSGFDLRQAQVP
jgi:hypothetical protein